MKCHWFCQIFSTNLRRPPHQAQTQQRIASNGRATNDQQIYILGLLVCTYVLIFCILSNDGDCNFSRFYYSTQNTVWIWCVCCSAYNKQTKKHCITCKLISIQLQFKCDVVVIIVLVFFFCSFEFLIAAAVSMLITHFSISHIIDLLLRWTLLGYVVLLLLLLAGE